MKVLIVGYGSIGRRHERICRLVDPECEIVLLTRNKYCQTKHASHVTDSLDEAIKFHPDCAIIASPATFHVEHVLALIKSGCDCLVEKPVADNLRDALRMQSAMKDSSRILQVGYNLRYDVCLNHVKEIIDKGIYGSLLHVRCEFGQYLPDWRPDKDYRSCVSANKFLGGGILLEMSHEVNYLSWLIGPIKWVSAWVGQIGNLDIDVEDTALLRIGMLKGEKEIVANLSMDFIRRDRMRRSDFICEEGTIRWDGINSTLTLESNRSQVLHAEKGDRNETYISQFRDFIECTQKRSVCQNDLVSGLRTLEVIEAARLSSHRSGIKCYL